MNSEYDNPPPTQFDIQKIRRLQSYDAAGDGYLVRGSIASKIQPNEIFFLKDMPPVVEQWFSSYFPTLDPSSPQPSQAKCIAHQPAEWTTQTMPVPPNAILYRQSELAHPIEPAVPEYTGPGQAIQLLGDGGFAYAFAVKYQDKTHAVKVVKDQQHLYQLVHEYYQITRIQLADPSLGKFIPQISLPTAEVETNLKSGFLFTELRPGISLYDLISDTATLPLFRPGTHFPTNRRHHLAITLASQYRQLHQAGHIHGDIKSDNLIINIHPDTGYPTEIQSIDYANSYPINGDNTQNDVIALRRLITQILFGLHSSLDNPDLSPENIFTALAHHNIHCDSPLADIAQASKISHILGYLNRPLFL